MLSLTLVLEIRRLLDEGELSQRDVADRLKVSRGSVGAIAQGRRGLFGRESTAPQSFAAAADQLAVRCPGCGGMAYQPCLLCQAREYRRRIMRVRRLVASLSRRPPRNPRRVA